MNRRAFLSGAVALPFIAVISVVPFSKARQSKRVRMTLPLIFQEGDVSSYFRDGRLHTPIGDKMKQAIDSILAANPHLTPDMKRRVSFDLRMANGKPWGQPGAVKLPAESVFKSSGPMTAPRNAIMAKNLVKSLHGKNAPGVNTLSRVVVRAVFNVAQT